MASIESNTPDDHPDFTPVIGGNGVEAAREDECVEETYLRLITNTSFFLAMNQRDQNIFLLELAAQCIYWITAQSDH